MWKRGLIFALLAFLFLMVADHVSASDESDEGDGDLEEEDFVLTLNKDNFDDTVKQHETVLTEFYAPWCGHCKNLAPEYSAAAEELSKDSPAVILAKIDATVETELAQRFEVQGYPTLRFFKNGKDYEYDGPRSKDGIVTFMRNIARPDWEPEPEAVVSLTSADFEEVTQSEDLMLVEFYAPWCGHCKRLAPIYEKAAKQMKKSDPPIMFAKVDATQNTEIAEKFGVTGYPTLKIFKKGRAIDYNGERRSEYDLISAVSNYIGDGVKEIENLKMLKDVLLPNDVTVIGFFRHSDDLEVATYKDVVNDLRDTFKFGITYDESSRKAYKVNPGSVVVFIPERFHTKFEPKWHVLDAKVDTPPEDITKFIKSHQVPLVGHYNSELKKRYDAIRPLCLVFYTVDFSFDHREATQMWRKKIAAVAQKFPDITFAIADDEEHFQILRDFDLSDSGEDMNIGLFDSNGKKYRMTPMEEFDADEISEFLTKFEKGKLKPLIKSQRPPKKQSGPVTVVVGETFKKIVLDPSKDVLVELYAPWCGHCKNLEPIYASLAKQLKAEKNLVIAKVDATANDVPEDFSSSGFPTIYFAPANNKKNPIKYDGAREVDDFKDFLKKHASASFGKNKDEL